MPNFILEIGSEEIPARFLQNEESELASALSSALDASGLSFESLKTMSTPRRLAIYVKNLAPFQKTSEEIITGPPAKIAYDENGNPTKPTLGFAKTNGVELSEIFRMTTPRGEYVACKKKTGGKSASEILREILPATVASISFPKSMRWGANETAYARPVKWLLALLDDSPIDFEYAGVRSGNITRGHRVLGAGPWTVPSADAWERTVKEAASVIPDSRERREIIVKGGESQAADADGKIIWNEELLDEAAGLCEYPRPLLGSFDPAYLAIPEVVLLTSMQTHQKSFGVRGPDGKLLPHFLTVLNIEPTDIELARKGWEKVLKARLEDAKFFWELDSSVPIERWLEKLAKVIFIGPLGSMADKSRRLEKLCAFIANRLDPPANAELAARAGALAKADLVSGMVGEFDTLQGIMGGIYAKNAGVNPLVADAISEQYLPAGPDSPLPASLLGAILSVADKADTLAGCFILGRVPTGAADPNGLRRCCLGIIRIFLADNINLSIKTLFREAISLYGDIKKDKADKEILAGLEAFFSGRLRHYFINKGYDTLFVDSVLTRGSDDLPDCQARLDALAAFARTENFENSIRVLKRVENIARKETAPENSGWNRSTLVEDAEIALADTLDETLPRLDALLNSRDYPKALAELENLRAPLDLFFEKVMVLCEDEKLRANRLALLKSIEERYDKIARFSGLQI